MRQHSLCFALVGCFIWLSTAIAGPYTGHPITPSAECAQFAGHERRAWICNSYDNTHTRIVDELPDEAEENTLYILQRREVRIRIPYAIPKGSAIIPSPSISYNKMAPLQIMPKNSFSDSKHILILKEGAIVNGVMLHAPQRRKGKAPYPDSSIIFGKTSSSEISDSHLIGSPSFTSLIHQQLISDGEPSTTQRYFVILELNGSENGLFVENSIDSKNSMGEFDAYSVIVSSRIQLSRSMHSSVRNQRGLFFVNINPEVKGSSFGFTDQQPHSESVALDQQSTESQKTWQGISLQGTPRVKLTRLTFSSLLEEQHFSSVIVENQHGDLPEIDQDKQYYPWSAEEFQPMDDVDTSEKRWGSVTELSTFVDNVTSVNTTTKTTSPEVNEVSPQNNMEDGQDSLYKNLAISTGITVAVLVTVIFISAGGVYLVRSICKWCTTETPATHSRDQYDPVPGEQY